MDKTFSVSWNHGLQSRILIAKKDHVVDIMIIESLRFGNENRLESLDQVVMELKEKGYVERK